MLMISDWLVEVAQPSVIPAFPMACPRERWKEASSSLYEANDCVEYLHYEKSAQLLAYQDSSRGRIRDVGHRFLPRRRNEGASSELRHDA